MERYAWFNITAADVIPLGTEILKMERKFNEAAGFARRMTVFRNS